MFQLVESIKVDNRTFFNLQGHSQRMHKARSDLFGTTDFIDLEKRLSIPECLTDVVHKCRVVYDVEIRKVSFEPYVYNPIRSLQLVVDNTAEYEHKYLDRAWLTALTAQKGTADDILIVKKGYITDTSRTNIIFFDGMQWVTPKTFLLNGTMRQQMLSAGQIIEKDIQAGDIKMFEKARAINAVLDLSIGDDITINAIYF